MTTQQQLFNYILVGGINTILGYLVYAFCIFLGMDYPLAAFFSTVFAVIFNYKTVGKFVFKNTGNGIFVKFMLMYLVMYLFNMAFIKFIYFFNQNLYLAGFIAICPAATLSFILNKFIVFRDVCEAN
ncbi:MAG: GtrA family protein [Gammaproteobacteria bacterium]|nr:GtrA family protein [Gammaproteobacteria bacterium]